MKKLLFSLAIVIITTNLIQAQVNGFAITDSYFPSEHNLGNSFPINVSFNWIPTATTSAVINIDYDPTLVIYDPSCASSLPDCINVANNGSQLTITLSDLSACTNTSSISFNVCFQFICPDTCTGVTKSALFDALITDNIPTTQTASCTSNGILANNFSLNHNFQSYNSMTNEITFKVCFNNPDCFIINNPSFDIALSPSLGMFIASVYGNNYTYSITSYGITPDVTAFNPNANDCFYYVVRLDSCNTGLGETIISNVTFKGTNCGIPNSTIKGPEQASFTIPAVPVATTNLSVIAYSSASTFSYNITNTGNTPLDLTATNFLPLVHLLTSPTSVMQTTTQPLLDGSIIYYDCALTPTGPYPLLGNGATDASAPGETKEFDHQVNNLLPGESVNLTLYYDLSSSCNGPAGDPPFKDSVSIVFDCNPGGGAAGGCVPCREGGITNVVVIYNPMPNIGCWTNQYFEGCKNVGDTLDFCYEFRNNGDADFTNGTYDIQLPAWLQAIYSSVIYTGFSTDPTIISSTNLIFNLPTIPFGTDTYKICFKAVVQGGAIGGPNSFWSIASGGNLINPQYVCYTSFNICAFAAIGIDKFVKGDLDGAYTTNGSGTPNSTVEYKITIHNTGTIPVDSLEVIDRIPRTGNLTILGSPTNSVLIPNDFAMEMLAATPTSDYSITYTDDQNICLPNPFWFATGIPCNAGTWGSLSPATKGVKFTFIPAFTLYPDDSYDIYFTTQIPVTAVNGMLDCNTAGFIGKSTIGGYTINPVEINPPVCITVVDDSCNFLCNTDFDDVQLVQPDHFGWFIDSLVPCWHTTSPTDTIEIWGDGYLGVPAYSGIQFIELNALDVATLYQSFSITAGSIVTISWAHRGRDGFTNQMNVSITDPSFNLVHDFGTSTGSTTSWTLHSETYTFPSTGTSYLLCFNSLPMGGTEAGGNFLDDISIACPASICGTKFSDLDGNGTWDPGEPGLANWTFNLTGSLVLTTTTDASGNFCFNDLPAGTYTVSEVNQSGCTQTAPPPPGTYTITLTEGQNIDSLLFGNRCQDTTACVDPPSGMVGWWGLDEQPGATSVNDIAPPPSSTVNNVGIPMPGGVIAPTGYSVPGLVGAGALFFYTGQYVEVAPQSDLDFGTGEWSIDAWVKDVGCGLDLLSPIVDKLDNNGIGFSFYLDHDANVNAFLKLNINGSIFTSSISFLANWTWYHVAVTVNPSLGVGTFYINGFPAGTFTPPSGSVTNTIPLWIGNIRVPGGFCEIAIDELELFNRVLPEETIYSIFAADSAGKCRPTTCSYIDARISPSAVGECCFLIEISNTYMANYFIGISISSNNLTLANVSNNNSWGFISYQSPTQVDFTKTPFSAGIPLDINGFQTLGTVCFAGIGPNQLSVNFLTGISPEFDTVCTKILFNEGCDIPVDTSCVSVVDIGTICEAGNPVMKFKIQNNSNFTMRGVTLYSQNTDIIASPHFIPIPDLLPGQTSTAFIETMLLVSNNATSGCFFIAACDQNTEPGLNGQFPQDCCMDSIPYCVEIPICDPCDAISITATENDPTKCCYDLSILNNYYDENIAFIDFTGIGGTQFAFLSGWSIIPPVSSSHIKIKAPAGGISPGNYPDFASFCLTGTSSAPHTVLVKIIDVKGNVLCTETLSFDCQLVEPTCANIINDSLYCTGDQIKYTFYVKNNAPFPLYHVDFHTPDNSIVLDTNYVEPNPPIAPGDTGGPFTVTIYSADADLESFCMYLTGHNGIYDPELGLAATECCTDSLGIVCLPMIKCNTPCDTTACCQFGNMIIPNGITPNDDGINDVFEIVNSSCCESIAIKVFNRWGNMVYQNDDYQNDWKGYNQSGTKLVQGTYFILLTLPTGSERASYIDIRY